MNKQPHMLQVCFQTITCSDGYLLGDHSPSDHSQSRTQTVSQCATNGNPKRILGNEGKTKVTYSVHENKQRISGLKKVHKGFAWRRGHPGLESRQILTLRCAVFWIDWMVEHIIHQSLFFNGWFMQVWALMLRQLKQDSSLWGETGTSASAPVDFTHLHTRGWQQQRKRFEKVDARAIRVSKINKRAAS